MPGISLKYVLNKEGIEKDQCDADVFLKALNSTIYNESYKSELLLKDGPYLLGCTSYPEYPIKIFENSEYWVCLEGKIYDKQEVDDEIYDLMKCIFSNRSISHENKKIISDWLLKTDGDFIIYALNKKTEDFVILNDVLGRLPLYYYWEHATELIVTRELPLISYLTQDNVDNTSKYDRMGIAQYLLLGFPLGKRTLLSDIRRVEAATILKIFSKSEISIYNIHHLNFESKKYANQSIEKNAQELVSLFSRACKERADFNAKNIICLSGGFDSRGVLACFHKNKIPGLAVTFFDPGWTSLVGKLSDAEVAEQLAISLNFEWENYDFMKPRAQDLLNLLRIKYALPYLANGYLLPSLDKLKHKGDLSENSIFTGHGGEILRISGFPREINDLSSLVSKIVHADRAFSLSDVAALVKLKESEIVDEITNIISSYPEESVQKKFMHFIYYESRAKPSFESEDVLRYYFWTTSPYFSIPFFNYAINCPDKHISEDALYLEFLGMLSPSVSRISISNWGCSILSRKYKILQFVLSLFWKYPVLNDITQFILSLMRKYPKFTKITEKKNSEAYEDNSKIIDCIREQINNCHNISNYLSLDVIENILNNYSNYTRVGIHNLFAVILLIEKCVCNNETIKNYYDN